MSEFDNINGIYAKDVTLREGIATLRNTVTSQTIKPLTVTQNGTYTADPSEGTYGYSPVTVDVQEQPWQPLEDGYSNFWFELTNDTLSPWLNFSAKNNDAVIDWGDGSGEVALDTLTPTHTYAKAGKYVVKVKGVTGLARQHFDMASDYCNVLKYAEFNNEFVTFDNASFKCCYNLKRCVYGGSVTSLGGDQFAYDGNLEAIDFPYGITTINGSSLFFCPKVKRLTIPSTVETIAAYAIRYCVSLSSITIPASVTSIGSGGIASMNSLSEIHIQASTPPTLGTNCFTSVPNDYVIYVPVGTGETYKAAAEWSAYANHILEEGQTPNRAMLSRLAKVAVNDDADTEEMR